MVTREAKVIEKDGNYYLELTLVDKILNISLTEDNQNNVKIVFNELILALKKEEFNFELINEENNLYNHISKEYIKQLNSELSTIYNELSDYNLLEEEIPAAATSDALVK